MLSEAGRARRRRPRGRRRHPRRRPCRGCARPGRETVVLGSLAFGDARSRRADRVAPRPAGAGRGMSDGALAVDLGGTELRAAIVDRSGEIRAFAATATKAKDGPAAVHRADRGRDRARSAPRPGAAIARARRRRARARSTRSPASPSPRRRWPAGTTCRWRALLAQRLGLAVRLRERRQRGSAGRVALRRRARHAVHGVRHRQHRHRRRGHRRRAAAAWAARAGGRDRPHDDRRRQRGRRASAACAAAGSRWPPARRWAGGPPGWRPRARRRRCASWPAAGRVTSRHVTAAARQGDQALALLASEARWLGIGIANLLHLYSPERVILGGGVGCCLDLMQAGIDRTVRARAMPPYRDVPVVAARARRAMPASSARRASCSRAVGALSRGRPGAGRPSVRVPP